MDTHRLISVGLEYELKKQLVRAYVVEIEVEIIDTEPRLRLAPVTDNIFGGRWHVGRWCFANSTKLQIF